MPAMLSTVSLIDPTTLNPSFSGPENSRLARPTVIITRGDQETTVDQVQLLLTSAKAYRLQMLALSQAAASFGYALEKIAHSKAAVRDASNVSPSLQAAAGLHYLMSNHHQILSDTLYKQFEIPLLQHLDTHKSNIEASEAQYERSMRDMSQKIKETEATSMQNGRMGQRDLLQFRQALTTLTMQVDELERIKVGYYFSNLESEQANLQLILQKTSTIVRAEVDIYERIANKGLNDAVLEQMTTQGPDPYCIYPTTDEFSSIFSILPATPIIPTSGTVGTPGTSTPQPDAIMSNFYGYHESNTFSTARHHNHTATRDRHLFGDASSVDSKESHLKKPMAISTVAESEALLKEESDSEAITTASTAAQPSVTGIEVSIDAASNTTTLSSASSSLPIDVSNGSTDLKDQAHSTEPDVDQRAPSQDKITQVLAAVGHSLPNGVHDNGNSSERPEQTKRQPTASVTESGIAVVSQRTTTSSKVQSKVNSGTTVQEIDRDATIQSNGVNLGAGQLHHRNQTVASTMSSTTPSELASSVRSHSLRSRSGSRSHQLLASTPDSPPVRGVIHIGQDSELLNNRDFSFSYEPSELLEQRGLHSQLNLGRHGSTGMQSFGGFGEMEEEEGGFGVTPPSRHHRHHDARSANQSSSSSSSVLQQHVQQHSPSSISSQAHSRAQGQQLQGQQQGLRHHASDSQLSRSSSSILSSIGSSSSGSISHSSSLHHRRSTGRIKDLDSAASAMFTDTSFEEPFLPSLVRATTAAADMRRGFDDGMPAYFADEAEHGLESPAAHSQPRTYSFGSSGFNSRRHSGYDQDMEKGSFEADFHHQPHHLTGIESILMADGSSKNVSTTNVSEIAA